MYAAIAGRLAVMMAVSDPIKSSSQAAIDHLHQQGLQVAMITGDNQHTANAIAQQLGIDHVVAQVLPKLKLKPSKRCNSNTAKWPMSATALMMRQHWPRLM